MVVVLVEHMVTERIHTLFRPAKAVVAGLGNGFLAVMAKPVAGEWIDDEFKGIAGEGIG